ncbi:hypothetical protein B0H16DRAFT_1551494 [Mycena metata]|uniref:Transmembrane protein n=1 Tax=Mycena metata TaxID=1033252 RepID=A0AAD7IUJ4_9AGAR|nr:hypothetical protein B0H16DRAFT_1551494 [Mycena metata]
MHRPQFASAAAVLVPLAALVVGVRAQNNGNSNTRGTSHSSAIIALIVAAVFILVLCCGIQRRRVARASAFRTANNGGVLLPTNTAYVPPPFPPVNATSRYPHGLQYGSYATPPRTTPTAPVPGSEYPLPPPGAGADWAPPPYMKEGEAVGVYAPPPGPPPPGFDAVYEPPPGPPPRAHISSNSQDFNGGFRPPPAS